MQKAKWTYAFVTVALMLITVYLYAKGFGLRSESFGLGLSYILPAVIYLGLSIVTGAMALLESSSDKLHAQTN